MTWRLAALRDAFLGAAYGPWLLLTDVLPEALGNLAHRIRTR